MCTELRTNLRKRHSSDTNQTTDTSLQCIVFKSDACLHRSCNTYTITTESDTTTGADPVKTQREYYKRYEHDEIPVKDDSSYNDHSFSEGNNSITPVDNKDSITNSALDKLEMKILRKMSQKLQTDDTSNCSLDSNIKLFKSTVQQIFDNFYNNMQDFEVYKQKFNDIIEKNKDDKFTEMEDFIRDMIQHIGTSDSSVHNKNHSAIKNMEIASNECSENESYSLNSTFKNDNYLTDSSFNENSSKLVAAAQNEETLNIYLLGITPRVEIKMNNRNMFSEINIKNNTIDNATNQPASAENIKKLAAKKLQLGNYAKEQQVSHAKERDIPIRISNAKKNIYLNEDFVSDDKEESKSFIFKICSYLCKRLRKNSFG